VCAVVAEVSVEINIGQANHFVAHICAARIVIDIVNCLDQAGASGTTCPPQ
jgi:hypothetical protein